MIAREQRCFAERQGLGERPGAKGLDSSSGPESAEGDLSNPPIALLQGFHAELGFASGPRFLAWALLFRPFGATEQGSAVSVLLVRRSSMAFEHEPRTYNTGLRLLARISHHGFGRAGL
jgi:hypothetical protein